MRTLTADTINNINNLHDQLILLKSDTNKQRNISISVCGLSLLFIFIIFSFFTKQSWAFFMPIWLFGSILLIILLSLAMAYSERSLNNFRALISDFPFLSNKSYSITIEEEKNLKEYISQSKKFITIYWSLRITNYIVFISMILFLIYSINNILM